MGANHWPTACQKKDSKSASTIHTICLSIDEGKHQDLCLSTVKKVLYICLQFCWAHGVLDQWVCFCLTHSSCMGFQLSMYSIPKHAIYIMCFQLSMHSIPMHAPLLCFQLSMYIAICPGPVCNLNIKHCFQPVILTLFLCNNLFTYVCRWGFDFTAVQDHTHCSFCCRSYCVHVPSLLRLAPQCIAFV